MHGANAILFIGTVCLLPENVARQIDRGNAASLIINLNRQVLADRMLRRGCIVTCNSSISRDKYTREIRSLLRPISDD